MQVDGVMLASELRRRRVRPRAMLEALGRAPCSTWVPGDLRGAPTPLLVLAALSMTGGPRGAAVRRAQLSDAGPSDPGPAAGPRPRSRG
jgi:hypothetical protein